MKKNEMLCSVKNAVKDLEHKKNLFFYHRFTKYVVDYRVEGDHIIVISNIGRTRKVLNTRKNMARLNTVIIRNKIDIANKIDDYEQTSKERSMLLLIDGLLLCGTGSVVVLTLFIGSYLLFLLSILLFSMSVISTSILGLHVYTQVKEIQNLKNITGYKKEYEFSLPKIELPMLKNKTIEDTN